LKHRARPCDGVQTHGEGFGQGGQGQIHVVAQGVGLIGFNHQVLSKRALNVGKAHGAAVKTHVEAVVLMPFLAVNALSAGPRWRDGHALAGAQVLHRLAHLRHDARDFVAQHHGLLQAHRAKAAMLEVMQIRAANAAVCDVDAHLLGAEGIGGKGFDAQIHGGVTDEGLHEGLLIAGRSRRHRHTAHGR